MVVSKQFAEKSIFNFQIKSMWFLAYWLYKLYIFLWCWAHCWLTTLCKHGNRILSNWLWRKPGCDQCGHNPRWAQSNNTHICLQDVWMKHVSKQLSWGNQNNYTIKEWQDLKTSSLEFIYVCHHFHNRVCTLMYFACIEYVMVTLDQKMLTVAAFTQQLARA